MISINPDSPLPQCFHDLVNVANEIKSGTKGIDFLVLCDDDEMKGYRSTKLEMRFRVSVESIEHYVASEGVDVSVRPEIIRIGLCSLVMVDPAVDAYRARMFAYATDWGSEISPVGNWGRKLQDIVDVIIEKMPLKEREMVYKKLPKDIKINAIKRIYWKSNDRHDDYYRSIKSILFPEKK